MRGVNYWCAGQANWLRNESFQREEELSLSPAVGKNLPRVRRKKAQKNP